MTPTGPTTPQPPPIAPRGPRNRFTPFRASLRTRLVVVFLLVATASALTAAVLTFRQARTSILHTARDNAIGDLRGQLDSLAPDLPSPPTTTGLRTLTLTLDRAGGTRQWRTAATYRAGPLITSAAAPADAPDPPADLLRATIGARTALIQRFHHDGTPWMAIAIPLTATDDPTAPSGLVVYATFSLASQERDTQALVSAARAGVLPVTALSLVPALFAARRVLMPVRRLRTASEKMAKGALDTRIPVTGNDELADLSRTFNAMATTLQADDQALRAIEAKARRFAADVSHELRTPLAAMAAVSEVLADDARSGNLPPDTTEAAELVVTETRRLTRLVDDLMEISRFDAGAAALHLDDIDIAELIAKTLSIRHWTTRIRVDAPRHLRTRLDPRRIDVVLANLVGNALKHGGPNAQVDIRVAQDDTHITLTVRDNGPGIPPEVLPHVFDRFVKGDEARTRSEGSGLGLAIAAENAHLHGGTLIAHNHPQGGAVFTLALPRHPS